MKLMPAICTQCGAVLSIDNSKETAICNYCGTPFITEKAINLFSTQYHININSDGNTIIIQGNEISKQYSQADDNHLAEKYTVTISRKRQLLSGSAVYFEFEVGNKKYRLNNGGTISFETDLKNAEILIYQKYSFGNIEPTIGYLQYTADGKDICIEVDTAGFDCFLLRKTSSTNETVTFSE